MNFYIFFSNTIIDVLYNEYFTKCVVYKKNITVTSYKVNKSNVRIIKKTPTKICNTRISKNFSKSFRFNENLLFPRHTSKTTFLLENILQRRSSTRETIMISINHREEAGARSPAVLERHEERQRENPTRTKTRTRARKSVIYLKREREREKER